MMKQTIIYTDGACLGNPGPGGWAAIVGFKDGPICELGGVDQNTTNNRMELLAVIEALNFVLENPDKFGSREVIVHSDSSYVVQGASKWIHGWKKKGWKNSETGDEIKNIDLWTRLEPILLSFKKNSVIDFRHIEGHAGILGNERCDEISNSLARGSEVKLFEGSSADYPFEYGSVPRRGPSAAKDKSKIYYLSLINGEIFRDETWGQCEARVKGKRGIKYKKCYSRGEEVEILKSWGVLQPKA